MKMERFCNTKMERFCNTKMERFCNTKMVQFYNMKMEQYYHMKVIATAVSQTCPLSTHPTTKIPFPTKFTLTNQNAIAGKKTCPLNGNCLAKHIIYSCNVKTSESEDGVYSIGLTENSLKDWWYQHSSTFKNQQKANSTELSKYIWSLKANNITPIQGLRRRGAGGPWPPTFFQVMPLWNLFNFLKLSVKSG